MLSQTFSILSALGRRLPAHALILAGLALLAGFAPGALAQVPDVEPAVTTSGLSIHHDFYEGLLADIVAQNQGRTAGFGGTAFQPHLAQANDELDILAGPTGFDAAAFVTGALSLLFPGLSGEIATIVIYLLFELFCGGSEATLVLELTEPSATTVYTLSAADLAQIAGGQEIDITVTDVGLASELVIGVFIGDPGSCGDDSKKTVLWTYPELHYKARITFEATGGVSVDAWLDDTFGSLELSTIDFPAEDFTGELLFDLANPEIGGTTVEEKIQEFALTDVAEHLENVILNYYVPYLAKIGWRMDLGGGQQNQVYAQNAVAGQVAAAVYQPLESDLTKEKIQVVFSNLHDLVQADPQAVCADTSPFDAGPYVEPDFASEPASHEGTYYTSYKTFEHRVLAGVRSAVGLRDEAKAGSDYIVDVSFGDMVPEVVGSGLTIEDLLTDTVLSPVWPIPLSSTQIADLVAVPTSPTETLGDEGLPGLRLEIEVCEVSKFVRPDVFGVAPGGGLVAHECVLEARIVEGGVTLLSETFDAMFVGDLRLSKVPREDRVEMRTIRALLTSLVNGSGLAADEVTGSTPFADAPISLFLRAWFGDQNLTLGEHDPRVAYAVEGLVAPLVERSAHGMVALPGLDFPAFTGPELGHSTVGEDYHGDEFDFGFACSIDEMCSTIVRWGGLAGSLGGVPSATNRMLVLELDWTKVGPPSHFVTSTNVMVNGYRMPSASPIVAQNPSRFDAGYLALDYGPALADETRMMDASGHRLGDWLDQGGTHYVSATPFGYAELRDAWSASFEPFATFELRPYHHSGALCDDLVPGPVKTATSPGAHHGTGPYEVLTFESRRTCEGPGACDGVRVVALWTWPLFWDCGGYIAQDIQTFETLEGTLRIPPSAYAFDPQPCGGVGGWTPGGSTWHWID